MVIAALRLFFASLALTPIVVSRYRMELRSIKPDEMALAVVSGAFLALHFATWITSLEYTSVASSVVFVSTGPLWVAIFSPVLLKENIAHGAIAGLVLALLGGALIGYESACRIQDGLLCSNFQSVLRERAMTGNLLALTGALAVAGYLMIGRNLRVRMSLVPYIFVVYSIAALGLIILMLSAGQTPFGYSSKSYMWIILLAIIPQLIGHSAYNWALRYLPAVSLSVTTLGEPIGSAILAFLILKERPGLFTILGGALILTGILLATKQKVQSRPIPS